MGPKNIVSFLILLHVATMMTAIACSGPEGTSKGDCTDQKDNDQNGFIDCEDDGCAEDNFCKMEKQRKLEMEKKALAEKRAEKKKLAEKARQDALLPYTVMEEIWSQKKTNGNDINQIDAVKYCENLVLGDKNDWRLPTKEEAIKLVKTKKLENESNVLWTSDKKNKKTAYIVGITTGAVNELKVMYSGQCRASCVRDK